MQEFENVAAWMIAGGPRPDEPSRGAATWRRGIVRNAVLVMLGKARAAGARGNAAGPACCAA